MTQTKWGWHLCLGVAMALTLTAPLPAFAAKDCGGYGALAEQQSREYFSLGCTNGLAEWWRADSTYHSSWCESLPADSALPGLGTQSRSEALLACKDSLTIKDDYAADKADPYASEGGPVKVVATGEPGLECRLKFGDFEFTADQVEGGIHGPMPGTNLMSAVCEYHHPLGSMRVSSSWAMPFPEDTPPAQPITTGCWREGLGQQETIFSNGFETKSEDYFAQASSSGSGELARIARGPARHFAREMLIIAHLHGPRSCR